MQLLKAIIPVPLKLFLKLHLRQINDIASGQTKLFAKKTAPAPAMQEAVCIKQVLKTSGSSANKLHNIKLAVAKIHHLIIEPGQVFSFWKLVGNPSEKNGYQKSRSIVNGELEAAVGGGLCQLSGLIYFLAIKTGMEITERHAHSIDIYADDERFTPLGSDATVAYGYKDLRFKNPFQFPVQLQFALAEQTLTGYVFAAKELSIFEIEFEYSHSINFTDVTTIKKENGQVVQLAFNRYRLMKR